MKEVWLRRWNNERRKSPPCKEWPPKAASACKALACKEYRGPLRPGGKRTGTGTAEAVITHRQSTARHADGDNRHRPQDFGE